MLSADGLYLHLRTDRTRIIAPLRVGGRIVRLGFAELVRLNRINTRGHPEEFKAALWTGLGGPPTGGGRLVSSDEVNGNLLDRLAA